jgi:hypothetical protein
MEENLMMEAFEVPPEFTVAVTLSGRELEIHPVYFHGRRVGAETKSLDSPPTLHVNEYLIESAPGVFW